MTSPAHWWKRLLGQTPWKKEWQSELSEVLHEAQTGLSVNMVVIIAHESDLYAELLYLFSLVGMALGLGIAYALSGLGSWHPADLLFIVAAGFAVGSTLHSFRRFFLHRLAPRAVRERVAQKAKAQFFDHLQQLKSRLALVYISEQEREALFLASPEIIDAIPAAEVQSALSHFVREYSARAPLKTLKPCLLRLGQILRQSLTTDATSLTSPRPPVFITASDRGQSKVPVPILKGTKDIN